MSNELPKINEETESKVKFESVLIESVKPDEWQWVKMSDKRQHTECDTLRLLMFMQW